MVLRRTVLFGLIRKDSGKHLNNQEQNQDNENQEFQRPQPLTDIANVLQPRSRVNIMINLVWQNKCIFYSIHIFSFCLSQPQSS